MVNPDARCAIYALSTDGENFRYAGFTQAGIRQRMTMHRWEAKHGRATELYDWMREVGPDNVIATVLEKLPLDSSKTALGRAEEFWISQLRAAGHRLFNKASGGLGAPGIKLSPERVEQLREKGRQQDLSHLHNPEMQARATVARTGITRGSYNWSPEGVAGAAEGRVKASHNRWHVARGLVKEGCTYCAL